MAHPEIRLLVPTDFAVAAELANPWARSMRRAFNAHSTIPVLAIRQARSRGGREHGSS